MEFSYFLYFLMFLAIPIAVPFFPALSTDRLSAEGTGKKVVRVYPLPAIALDLVHQNPAGMFFVKHLDLQTSFQTALSYWIKHGFFFRQG
jgi:hypothetical protein